MSKSWHIQRKVHLGMKVYHHYQDAYSVYGTVSYSANNASEYLARVLNQYGETIASSWFNTFEEAKRHIEIKTARTQFHALKMADMSPYYFSKLYLYDKRKKLMQTFKSADAVCKALDCGMDYIKSIFVVTKNELAVNDNRINYLSISKFQQNDKEY
jgi:hypothetical protein